MNNLRIGYWNKEKKYTSDEMVVNFDETIDQLKAKIAEKLELDLEGKRLGILYAGLYLDGHLTLKQAGLKPDCKVFIGVHEIPVKKAIDYGDLEADLKKHMDSFKFLSRRNAHNRYKEKVNDAKIFNEVVTSIPGLCQDCVALCLLKHPELLMTCDTEDMVRGVIARYPSLVLAVTHVMGLVQKDFLTESLSGLSAMSSSSSSQASNMHLHSGSDEEDAQWTSEEMSVSSSAHASPSNTPNNYITLSQLSAAFLELGAQSQPAAESRRNTITPEMLTNAVNQALLSSGLNASAGSGTSIRQSSLAGPSTSLGISALSAASESVGSSASTGLGEGSASAEPSSSAGSSGIQDGIVSEEKLQQMREYGCSDDSVNIHALQVANGDVQTAINIVLCGVMTEDMQTQ